MSSTWTPCATSKTSQEGGCRQRRLRPQALRQRRHPSASNVGSERLSDDNQRPRAHTIVSRPTPSPVTGDSPPKKTVARRRGWRRAPLTLQRQQPPPADARSGSLGKPASSATHPHTPPAARRRRLWQALTTSRRQQQIGATDNDQRYRPANVRSRLLATPVTSASRQQNTAATDHKHRGRAPPPRRRQRVLPFISDAKGNSRSKPAAASCQKNGGKSHYPRPQPAAVR